MTLVHLFVYGTLRHGESRWHHLEPFVVDAGADDSVTGALFDTGYGYPAARFDGTATIVGQVFRLRDESLDEALETLDRVEGAVRGLYRRVEVTTHGGLRVWSYEWGDDRDASALTAIADGDWFRHRRAAG